jgi:hypothetical protein
MRETNDIFESGFEPSRFKPSGKSDDSILSGLAYFLPDVYHVPASFIWSNGCRNSSI